MDFLIDFLKIKY